MPRIYSSGFFDLNRNDTIFHWKNTSAPKDVSVFVVFHSSASSGCRADIEVVTPSALVPGGTTTDMGSVGGRGGMLVRVESGQTIRAKVSGSASCRLRYWLAFD